MLSSIYAGRVVKPAGFLLLMALGPLGELLSAGLGVAGPGFASAFFFWQPTPMA